MAEQRGSFDPLIEEPLATKCTNQSPLLTSSVGKRFWIALLPRFLAERASVTSAREKKFRRLDGAGIAMLVLALPPDSPRRQRRSCLRSFGRAFLVVSGKKMVDPWQGKA